MKQKKKKFYFTRIGLLVTGLVFLLLLLTHFVSNSIFMLIHRNSLPPMRPGNPLYPMLFQNACFSIISGTLLTFLLSHFPLRPIHSIIQAIHDVAEGRFDTKLHIEHPREFRELSHSFNQMTEELSGIEILRSDFIDNFSHEFKTPMVSILGFAKILRNKKLSGEERNEYLDIIIDEASRLTELSANILNLSRIESMSLPSDLSEFNLSEQIRQSILQSESKWMEKNLDFSLDIEELYIRGNEPLLKQVWLNLIDNAVKFSPENGRLELSLHQTSSSAVFSITDHGEGMDSAVVRHIFEKFYQGDTSHTAKGHGLGLSIAQKIVRLHKGEISVHSEPGKGSTFTVALPLSLSDG